MLYRADRLELDPLSARGTNTQSQSIIQDPTTGEATFGLNPGASCSFILHSFVRLADQPPLIQALSTPPTRPGTTLASL